MSETTASPKKGVFVQFMAFSDSLLSIQDHFIMALMDSLQIYAYIVPIIKWTYVRTIPARHTYVHKVAVDRTQVCDLDIILHKSSTMVC